MQDVYHLGDISHLEAIGVLVEYIQCQGGDDSVPHGILLEKMAGIGPRLHIVPCAPLIQEQVDPVVGIIKIHNRLVVLDDLVDLDGLGDYVIVVLVGELCG